MLGPEDFIARLCVLVAPPRFHLMRYLGVLAGHSSLRAEVVPKKPAEPSAQFLLFGEADEPSKAAKGTAKKMAEPSRHPWSWLLQRVFAVDVLKCERCGGRLRLVESAKKPNDISRVLGDLSYARAPPRAESSNPTARSSWPHRVERPVRSPISGRRCASTTWSTATTDLFPRPGRLVSHHADC